MKKNIIAFICCLCLSTFSFAQEKLQIAQYVVETFQDSKGNLWLGCAGGLYKIDKNGNIKNITTTDF